MNITSYWRARVARMTSLLLVLAASGCANFYVDGTTKEVPASQFKKPVPTHPVQMLFEFQTKGVANARATDLLKTKVLDQVNASGLFSAVSEAPVDGAALISITLNNVPLSDDAFSKGFVTGLTFGFAGSKVSDGYVCTMRYQGGTSATQLTKQARHAIHTTIGAAETPGNATKATDVTAAVTLMTHQVISNLLNDLSRDPGFR